MFWSTMATAAFIILVIGFTLLPIGPELMTKNSWALPSNTTDSNAFTNIAQILGIFIHVDLVTYYK